MKLLDLLNLANEAYPDGYLSEYYDNEAIDPSEVYRGEGMGDFLADCIVVQLIDCWRENPDCTDDEMLATADATLQSLADQLDAVQTHLASIREMLYQIKLEGGR